MTTWLALPASLPIIFIIIIFFKVSKEEEEEEVSCADDYDRAVRDLQFERRGQALDRLKTEEKLAAEEKERLEKLEVRNS